MDLIIPSSEVVLAEVAQVKRDPADWRGALEEPLVLWDGSELAEALQLIELLPEGELTRCFSPRYGMRLHDGLTARAEVLFCFRCDMALMIDLTIPGHGRGATFDPESEPARELLSRFQSCVTGR